MEARSADAVLARPTSAEGAAAPLPGDPDQHPHPAEPGPLPPLAPDADALFSARSLWLTRAGRAILQGIDIDIAEGEILTLIGPNGAGKTTLVRVLLGLERADRGTILRKRGLVVGYVPQRFEVDRAIPLTVGRFVQLGRRAEDEKWAAKFEKLRAGRAKEKKRRAAVRWFKEEKR